MKNDWWAEVNKIFKSDEDEKIIEFDLPKKDYDKLSDYKAVIVKPNKCRLIRVMLEDGETEILRTSLLDPIKYETTAFGELYHLRWNHEESYKLLKNRAELESFSGKKAIAVKQDFHAKILSMTLCAA